MTFLSIRTMAEAYHTARRAWYGKCYLLLKLSHVLSFNDVAKVKLVAVSIDMSGLNTSTVMRTAEFDIIALLMDQKRCGVFEG